MSKDAPGYRILARRLARDLRDCLAIDTLLSTTGVPTSEWVRIHRRATATLHRFEAYERTYRRSPSA